MYWYKFGKLHLMKEISKLTGLSQETVTDDFGIVDSRVIQDFVAARPPKFQSSYHRWTDNERYTIEKYVTKNGNSTAIRKFKLQLLLLTESTVQTFKKYIYE